MSPTSAILIFGVCCIFWICQFVQLMLLSEADFPGKYDKCLWTAAFILTFILAPLAFVVWKHAYRGMLAAQRHRDREA
jgi:hypothetical protein